jgi:hypothetical protein
MLGNRTIAALAIGVGSLVSIGLARPAFAAPAAWIRRSAPAGRC